MINDNFVTGAWRRKPRIHPLPCIFAGVFALALAYAALVGRPVEDQPEVRRDAITYQEARAFLKFMDGAKKYSVHPAKCFICHGWQIAGAGDTTRAIQ